MTLLAYITRPKRLERALDMFFDGNILSAALDKWGENKQTDECVRLAQAELDFLKSLLPKEEET